MSNDSPEPGEIWQESDGHLLKCFPPGIWARFGTPSVVPPDDPSIAFPLRRVFTRFGVPTLDDPIKGALLEDLELAQTDRDRWRDRAVWLSNHTTSLAARPGPEDEQEQEQEQQSGFVPPRTD